MSTRNLLLASLDEAYDRKSWHGTNLRGSLRGLTAEDALWQPAPGRHSIWDLTLHCAYWKYVVRRRLSGMKRGSFALPGSNFFDLPKTPGPAEWKEALELLASEHRQLRAFVETLDDARFAEPNVLRHLRGVAAHDLYHAGQIQLLKRLRAA